MAAVGMTIQNSQGVRVWNYYGHDLNMSYAVGYQVDGLTFYNPIFGRAGGDAAPPAGLLTANSTHAFNVELGSNVALWNPQFNKTDKNRGVHFTFSNFNPESYTFRNGSNVNMTNGFITIYNPTYTDIWGNGRIFGQRLYANNAVPNPVVTRADFKTLVPLEWVDGSGKHNDIG